MKNLKINKQLIASLLSVTLVTSMCGCAVSSNTGFEYDIVEEQNELTGNISYEDACDIKVLVVHVSTTNTDSLYFVKERNFTDFNDEKTLRYYDVFTDSCIYNDKIDLNTNIVTKVNLRDYLVGLNKIQTNYSVEDLKELEQIVKGFYKENSKTLVKGE